jgi:two-component system LytT family response regulator
MDGEKTEDRRRKRLSVGGGCRIASCVIIPGKFCLVVPLKYTSQPPGMSADHLNVFIVDDEYQSRNLLCKLLRDNFHNTTVAGQFGNIKEALPNIRSTKPDLLFLDIEMQGETGFDLLEQLKGGDIQIIFVTAHSEYALKAFRYNAVDYLLKPIILSELGDAIQKALRNKRQQTFTSEEQLVNLIRAVKNPAIAHDKIAVPTSEGFVLIPVQDIIFCHARGNYTQFHLTNNRQVLSSYTLKQYHELLTEQNFFRVHRSYLINMSYVKMYRRGEGGTAVMHVGTEVEISKQNKEAFLHFFKS